MSYIRVIPRDLFNEGNLLKCLGRIAINLESSGFSNVELAHDGEAFDVHQDPGSGDIFANNVTLNIGEDQYYLYRPINSRDIWPLYIFDKNEEPVEVFADDGSFSSDMNQFFESCNESSAPDNSPKP